MLSSTTRFEDPGVTFKFQEEAWLQVCSTHTTCPPLHLGAALHFSIPNPETDLSPTVPTPNVTFLDHTSTTGSSKPLAQGLLTWPTSLRSSPGDQCGAALCATLHPHRPGSSAVDMKQRNALSPVSTKWDKPSHPILPISQNNTCLPHQWSFIHCFQTAPPPCMKSTQKRYICIHVNGSFFHWWDLRGTQIHLPHFYSISSAGLSLWTERDVKFLGVKQRDLLGAKQEVEPRALVLIRWQ